MKASVYIASSLDGFIARPNGELDWLTGRGTGLEPEDYGYDAFIATVDYLVMGRHTYEKVQTFGAWPYQKPVVVLSSGTVKIPKKLMKAVEAMSGSPREVVAQLEKRGAGHLYIDGGKTIHRFLEDGLIDRMIITRLPVLIGTGIPLFGALSKDIWLRHVATKSFRSGVVQSEYTVGL